MATLEHQLTERFGLLLSQAQLAELLGRCNGGLRYRLSYICDQQTRSLKACGRKIGRRVYYPASEVARIIIRAPRRDRISGVQRDDLFAYCRPRTDFVRGHCGYSGD